MPLPGSSCGIELCVGEKGVQTAVLPRKLAEVSVSVGYMESRNGAIRATESSALGTNQRPPRAGSGPHGSAGFIICAANQHVLGIPEPVIEQIGEGELFHHNRVPLPDDVRSHVASCQRLPATAAPAGRSSRSDSRSASRDAAKPTLPPRAMMAARGGDRSESRQRGRRAEHGASLPARLREMIHVDVAKRPCRASSYCWLAVMQHDPWR